MKPLTTKQAERWRQTRRMGRNRYTIIYGVLLWGLTSGTVWAVAMAWIMGWQRLPVYFAGGIIVFPLGGIFWGRMMWHILEARCNTTLNKKARHK